ncbi:MAG: hypothetical protein E6X72_15400 [Clostridioides difficile]|nr:hypothetical protein [Clostridioides difficile]
MKNMMKQILNTDIPKKYKPGLIQYIYGIDTEPNLLDVSKCGYTDEEYRKIDFLIAIELMKYHLQEDKKDKQFRFYHLILARLCILKMIWKYNKLKFNIPKKQ